MKFKKLFLALGLSLTVAGAALIVSNGSKAKAPIEVSASYTPAQKGLTKITSSNIGEMVGKKVVILSDNLKYQLAWDGSAFSLPQTGDFVQYTVGSVNGSQFTLYCGDTSHYLGYYYGFGFKVSQASAYPLCFENNDQLHQPSFGDAESFTQEGFIMWTGNQDGSANFYYGGSPVMTMYGEGNFNLYALTSGKTYIDLYESASEWDSDNAKFGVYYWNSSTLENGWCSGFATEEEDGSHIYSTTFELSFIPTNMKVVRFNSSATELRFNTYEKEDYVWNETSNLSFHRFGMVGIKGWTTNVWDFDLAETDGLTNDLILSNYKRNGSGNPEHYLTGVSLVENAEFDIDFAGNHYYTYTPFSGIASNFELNNNKIRVKVAGTYALYFDTTNYSLYITDPALAAADEFAQSFLTKTNGYCNDSISVSVQSTLKAEYDALESIPGAQAAFYGATVIRGKNVEYASYASQAISRYANMQEEKGYTDFLGLDNHNPLPSNMKISKINQSNNQPIVVALIVGAISLVSVGGFFFIRKRKEN